MMNHYNIRLPLTTHNMKEQCSSEHILAMQQPHLNVRSNHQEWSCECAWAKLGIVDIVLGVIHGIHQAKAKWLGHNAPS